MTLETDKHLAKLGLEVADHTNVMLAYWDKDLICRFANNAYIHWFGINPVDMINKMHIRELLGPLYDSNLEHIKGALAGKVQVFERTIHTPTGVSKIARATYYPDFVDGKVRGFYAQVADVSPLNDKIASEPGANRGNIFANEGRVLEDVVTTLKACILSGFPGITFLAKKHFISESKLKRDFKEKYNETIFEYFRNLQMELAHKYLVEKKCNKSQMAVMLNFANPSNFSVCYSKYLTKNATKELITNIKKESDERYKTFIRQVPATIAMLDNDLCYLAASLNWIKYYRLQNKEFIGKNFYDLHPGSKSIYGKRLSECLKGKIDNCDEALIEKLDGSRAWLRWDFRPWYNVDNEIGGLIMLTEDLTASKLKDEEHKQISAILNKTSEISRIGTWQRNFETEDGTWSPVLKEIMEVPDDFVPPDMSTTYNFYKEGPHRDLVKMVIKYALEKGQEFDIETEIITAKGNSKKVRIIGYPELINGKCEKISGIFQELTNHLIIS